jgi:VWFA-related protein
MRAVLLPWIALCLFSIPGFLPAGASPAQVSPTIAPAPPLIPTTDRRITLDVVVTDHSGKPVSGLQQQDFTILDNKKPQAIASFREATGTGPNPDPPFTAMVIVDGVNNTHEQLGFLQGQLATYVKRGGGELPVPLSLDFLTDASQNQTAATRDGNAVAASLNSANLGLRTLVRSQGFYGAAERTDISQRSLQQLVTAESNQPGRKLLIWLGGGWPYLEGPNVILGSRYQKALFQNIVWLSTMLRQARITLYSVDSEEGLGQSFYFEQFLKGVSSAKSVRPGDLTLQVLAVQTGGEVLNRSNDLPDSITQCLQDAKIYYTLTFDSPAANYPDEYHSLQVKIGKPHLTVRTGTGYYAQP